ncbi:hypothetical protein [Paeniglutamicibacter psychrophenolicus]|uniref:hypothetical protein n=1 Tax=Paeniglutamicibacter psychrophenolicus TaxID=257454 RepID=UPI002780E826|nr:hypothetical protein [Paeniglutamicibacter psychrophenolicus]MDQ0093066.1 hypothetical protein [Paeniglutamicibacter psychrophenolicus]
MALFDPSWVTVPDAIFRSALPDKGTATTVQLHRVLIRALSSSLSEIPDEETLKQKPLIVKTELPLPHSLRFYIYNATQHASERQLGTFKIQLTSGIQKVVEGSSRYEFDRSLGVRPIVVGYHLELDVFILWDTDLHDAGAGFPFSKSIQAPPEVVFGALSAGLAEGERRLKGMRVSETIVCARPARLVEALSLRLQRSTETLLKGGI